MRPSPTNAERRRRGLPHVDCWQKVLCTELRNARLRELALGAPWGFCWRATVADGVDDAHTELGAIEAVATPDTSPAVVQVVTAWDAEDEPEAYEQQTFSLHSACEEVALALVEGIVADI